jgi:hypothetical protein
MKYTPLLVMLVTAVLTYAGLSRIDSIQRIRPVLANSSSAAAAQPFTRIQAAPLTTQHVGAPVLHFSTPKKVGGKKSA